MGQFFHKKICITEKSPFLCIRICTT